MQAEALVGLSLFNYQDDARSNKRKRILRLNRRCCRFYLQFSIKINDTINSI